MTETLATAEGGSMKALEEIALQVAKDAAKEISGASAAEMTPEAEAWSIAFARRLVAALGAQEAVAEVAAGVRGDRLMWACSDSQGSVPVGTKLYAAPVVPEGWQMVPKEPTEAMISEAFKVTRYNEGVGSGADLYMELLAAAPEYGK